MSTEIIISLVFGVASVVSSVCFGLIPTIRKTRLEKLEIKIQRLLWNMKLYHEIEDEMLNRIASTGANKQTTQREVRNKVYKENGNRMLSDEAKPSVYNKQIK
jgi:Na+-translocating ferredoxin:NAD+ oxidoreductase RnfG subunit